MPFKCPRCESVSHHPEDARHGYCVKCHDFTRPAAGNIPNAGATHVFVDGIVSARDGEPYVRLTVNGEKAQLNVAEATKIARSLLTSAARTEADAMLYRFFNKNDFPDGAAAALMTEFRYYRQTLDEKDVESVVVDPESGETIR
jgi:hypothetical protein